MIKKININNKNNLIEYLKKNIPLFFNGTFDGKVLNLNNGQKFQLIISNEKNEKMQNK